jgi:isovaleryl-CoA dehydrogenase
MTYLPRLTLGSHVGALAMTEVGSGSDVLSMQLKATKKEGRFVLNGNKMFITNGPIADIVIVYARTSEQKKGITAFIVDTTDLKGYSTSQKLDKFGIRGSPTGELVFEDCEIPEENILGEVDGGTKVLMSGLNHERVILGAVALGALQQCIDFAAPFLVSERPCGEVMGLN